MEKTKVEAWKGNTREELIHNAGQSAARAAFLLSDLRGGSGAEIRQPLTTIRTNLLAAVADVEEILTRMDDEVPR